MFASKVCALMGGAFLMSILPAQGGELTPLDIRQVEVGGEIGRRIEVTVENNLVNLEIDKDFLQPFRDRKQVSGYIGLGKLLDALVRFAAYTEDPRVLERKKHVAAEIIKLQEPDGYVGMFRSPARLKKLWDVHEMGYIVYALTMDHRFFGEEASLAAARKAADYIINGWDADLEKALGSDITVYMAVTGLEPALLALHQATGDAKYLDFCAGVRKLPAWEGDIVLGRWGPIQGHAYAYFCRSLAQLRLHRVQPDERLLGPTRRVTDFLLEGDGLSITGTCGQHECWHNTQDGIANLGETCATAYLVRFLDELLRMEGDPQCGDLMERAIFNALFAAQSPDGRRLRYYVPFEGPRVYWDGDTYCCPCNYRRIIAELPGMIFYGKDGGVAVNLYTPSTVKLDLPGGAALTLTQETDYPSSGDVTLRVEPATPTQFPLVLRIPKWCLDASVEVNGQALEGALKAGSFHTIEREWRSGDTVTLHFPMKLQLVKGRKAQSGRVAVMYGPTVFCLNPENNKAIPVEDLRVITLSPDTLEGPFSDDSVRPGGMACTVRAWRTTSWYPHGKPEWKLTLTEFPDPDGQATYFHVPNPNLESFVDDELTAGDRN